MRGIFAHFDEPNQAWLNNIHIKHESGLNNGASEVGMSMKGRIYETHITVEDGTPEAGMLSKPSADELRLPFVLPFIIVVVFNLVVTWELTEPPAERAKRTAAKGLMEARNGDSSFRLPAICRGMESETS